MIINDTAPRHGYTAIAGQTEFTYSFPIFEDSDLEVYQSSDGVPGPTDILTLTVDYTVSGAGSESGGTVTLTTGATAGDILVVRSKIPHERDTEFVLDGPFTATAINNQLNDLTQQIKQLEVLKANRRFEDSPAINGQLEISQATLNNHAVTLAQLNAQTAIVEAMVFNASTSPVVSAVASLRNLDSSVSVSAFVSGHSVALDGGGGSYFVDPADTTSTDNDGNIIVASDGARWKKQGAITVKTWGALGDGANDDSVAIQAAIDYAIAVGGAVVFPAGEYLCSARLIIDETSGTGVNDLTKFAILGDGMGNTRITFTGNTVNTVGILFSGIPGSTFSSFNFQMKDISLKGNSAAGIYGVFITHLVWTHWENVYISGFNYGLWARDTLSMVFSNCFFRANNFGARFAYEDLGNANALSFFGCNFSNLEQGLNIIQASTLNIYGGAFEGNGNGGTGITDERFGIKLQHDVTSDNGVTACNIQGVYFELTDGVADLLITNSSNDSLVFNTAGCLFHRTSATAFSEHHIQVDCASGSEVKLVTTGNGYKNFGAYVPSATRKAVSFETTAGDVSWADRGSLYTESAEDPTRETLTGPGALSPWIPQHFIVTTGADAYTLADGITGNRTRILMSGDGGDGTLTPDNLSGGTTITFDDAGDWAILEWMNTAWFMTAGTATLA